MAGVWSQTWDTSEIVSVEPSPHLGPIFETGQSVMNLSHACIEDSCVTALGASAHFDL